MKGDFSRFTFDPARHAHGVLMQQGRLQLDADQVELQAVQSYRVETETVDVVGPVGVPKLDNGFRITLTGADQVTIGKGRIYLHGLLAENEADRPVTEQPSLPGFTLPDQGGLYLAFIDIHLRQLTALDDPAIREVALGGADTAIRETVIWQVKFLRVGDPDPAANCESVGAVASLQPGARGTLVARAQFTHAGPDPCLIAPDAAFRGVENQLYRVEIHRGGDSATATFKWSRNNASLEAAWLPDDVGANKIKISSVGRDGSAGFEKDQWVELLDDTNELYDDTTSPLHDALDPAGHPGELVQIDTVIDQVLELKSAPPARGTRNPKVRGWDMPAGPVRLDQPTTADGFVELENGVQVRFDQNAVYTAGDYWLIPARTITADIEWPGTPGHSAKPPDGTTHHYAPLALLTTDDGQNWTLLDDCRPVFPSLTEISAEDVGFDNTICDLAGADTVQDALDALCGRSDLKKHNRHLHGWGVVNGLQVGCACDGPGSVTVKPGYAIDCQGNDLDLTEGRTFDVLAAARDAGLVDNGKADVGLILAAGDRGLELSVDRHEPTDDSFASFLKGTIIMDFVDECLRPLKDFWDQHFTVPPGEQDRPVGPAQKRITALSNAVVQVPNPDSGGTTFISRAEHDILKALYSDLQALLSSPTFCAMWNGARPFPDYPFADAGMDIIFGAGFHHRIRLHPDGTLGYTTGSDDKIHVFDLARKEMVAVLEHPGDLGSQVTDIAFSPDGRQLHAAAIKGNDTVFATADIAGLTHTWRESTSICDVLLVTLATTPGNTFVYGIGQYKGLYQINPDNVEAHPNPLAAFDATGHLTIAGETGAAYAAVETKVETNKICSVVALELRDSARVVGGFSLPGVQKVYDLVRVFDPNRQADVLYVATDAAPATGSVLGFKPLSNGRLIDNKAPATLRITDRSSPLALAQSVSPSRSLLLVAIADENSLVGRDLLKFDIELVSQPVQISPVDVVMDRAGKVCYVLNQGSSTVSIVPAQMLEPGSNLDLQVLADYRIQVVNALADLLGGLLQYLKDCLCERLLVDPPRCDETDKVYLACVHIRDDAVYQVCNFSKRRYVKSFPTVGYWLSLVPIVPLIARVVEIVCCAVLPDRFGEFDAGSPRRGGDRVSTSNLQAGLALFGQLANMRVNSMRRFQGVTPIITRFLDDKAEERRGIRVDRTDVIGRPVDEVQATLEDRGVVVDRVEPFDPSLGFTNLIRATTAPVDIPPGSRVTLLSDGGVVRYYALTSPTEPSDLVGLQRAVGETQQAVRQREADLRDVRSDLDMVSRQQAEIAAVATPEKLQNIEQLRSTLELARAEIATRDQEISVLKDSVAAMRTEIANSPTRLTSIESELRDLREFRARVTSFMQERPQPPDQ